MEGQEFSREKRLVNCRRSKQLESVQEKMFIAQKAVGKLGSLLYTSNDKMAITEAIFSSAILCNINQQMAATH